MRISSINRDSTFFQSFKQNENSSLSLGTLTGVDNKVDKFVLDSFQKYQKEKVERLSIRVFDNFIKNWDKKVEDIEKFSNSYNKALMLNQVAHSYHKGGQIEKAGIIFASSFNLLNQNLGYFERDKNKLIEKKENIDLLKDFFYCSNNQKAKYFVMKSLNDLNHPLFLPIAEDVCECDADVTTNNDRRTIYEARKFINKNYNLNNIKDYLSKEDVYKVSALDLISKWGLAEHSNIVERLCNDENLQIQALAQNTRSKLQQISNFGSADKEAIDAKSSDKIPVGLFVDVKNPIISKNDLKALKYHKNKINLKELSDEISKTKDITRSIELINILGQIGFLTKQSELAKPVKDENKMLTKFKALALLKISIRNEFIINNLKLRKES